jgi:hypothetical protein
MKRKEIGNSTWGMEGETKGNAIVSDSVGKEGETKNSVLRYGY